MKKNCGSLQNFLMLVFLLAFSAKSEATGGDGFLFSLNPLYMTSKTDASSSGSTTSSENKKNYMNFNLGYQMGTGLYVGGLYITDSWTNNSTNGSLNGLAASVGYLSSGWFVHGHYLISGEYDSDTSTSAKYKNGSGIEVDVGYMQSVSGPFHVGLQFAYRNFEFKTFNNGTTDDSSSSLKLNELYPQFRLTLLF